MVGDVSAAYLEVYTQQMVCLIAVPEICLLEGYLLVIVLAWKGLCKYGDLWLDMLSDVLQSF
jgi:hypothetical protein